jgi:hypothetical protein
MPRTVGIMFEVDNNRVPPRPSPLQRCEPILVPRSGIFWNRPLTRSGVTRDRSYLCCFVDLLFLRVESWTVEPIYQQSVQRGFESDYSAVIVA